MFTYLYAFLVSGGLMQAVATIIAVGTLFLSYALRRNSKLGHIDQFMALLVMLLMFRLSADLPFAAPWAGVAASFIELAGNVGMVALIAAIIFELLGLVPQVAAKKPRLDFDAEFAKHFKTASRSNEHMRRSMVIDVATGRPVVKTEFGEYKPAEPSSPMEGLLRNSKFEYNPNGLLGVTDVVRKDDSGK